MDSEELWDRRTCLLPERPLFLPSRKDRVVVVVREVDRERLRWCWDLTTRFGPGLLCRTSSSSVSSSVVSSSSFSSSCLAGEESGVSRTELPAAARSGS